MKVYRIPKQFILSNCLASYTLLKESFRKSLTHQVSLLHTTSTGWNKKGVAQFTKKFRASFVTYTSVLTPFRVCSPGSETAKEI